SVLGFGTGNLQDAKMEAMADNGNGNFFYVDDLREARKVFVQEIAGTLVTVAKDVKLQIEFNPQHVAGYRLIGYENRALADHEFDDDSVDSGDIGAGHSVTALYEIVPIGVESDVAIRTTAELRYQQTAPSDASSSDELAYVRIRYKEPDGAVSRLIEVPVATTVSEASEDVRFAAAVAGFGMLLRGSEHSGGTTIDMIRGLARSGRGVDELGYRTEFIDLVDRYARLRTVEAEN
ncbi:MAG TPA: YfbK domain-containing protein, partial [Thermoanaerobaculia bacterium]